MEETVPLKPLSESYPPTSQNNYLYLSEVHKVIREYGIKSFNQSDISFRHHIKAEDLEELKQLHREWFPIIYDNNFYNSILIGQVYPIVVDLYVKQLNRKFIVGFASYNYKEVNSKYCRVKWSSLFAEDISIYILTIGVINEFRNFGIGTQIINEIKLLAKNNANIKYIYLHMVVYNKSGTAFYQKNGF